MSVCTGCCIAVFGRILQQHAPGSVQARDARRADLYVLNALVTHGPTADVCTTILFFDRVCVFSVFGWTFTCAWQSRYTKVFTGGLSVVREGPAPHPARLSYSVGFGWTTTQLFNVFRAPESFHDADEVVAVRRIEFNRTRDAIHVQVHSFSLTSKRLPSVPDTRLVLLLLAPLLCRPHLVVQMLSSFLRPHFSSLTSSVT